MKKLIGICFILISIKVSAQDTVSYHDQNVNKLKTLFAENVFAWSKVVVLSDPKINNLLIKRKADYIGRNNYLLFRTAWLEFHSKFSDTKSNMSNLNENEQKVIENLEEANSKMIKIYETPDCDNCRELLEEISRIHTANFEKLFSEVRIILTN